jgi:hypothetical protein
MFIEHLCWHKKRPALLNSKIEGLPDGHRSKPRGLLQLSRPPSPVGNFVGKRLLTHALKIKRKGGSDPWVTRVLIYLSDANRLLDSFEEGIAQVKDDLLTDSDMASIIHT